MRKGCYHLNKYSLFIDGGFISNYCKDNSRFGVIAEVKFTHEAMENGLNVSVPVGGTLRYDAIVDSGTSLKRVQVKSTRTVRKGRKSETWSRASTTYSNGDFDYMAFYSFVRNCWWIIPAETLKGLSAISFSDDGEISLYRDAWHLLK